MKYLLDTCTFLWAIGEPKRLPSTVKKIIQSAENEIYLSAVSSWEISIQVMLKRIRLPDQASAYILRQREQHRIASLPLDEESALYLERLPNIHKDPFDRMLISQSLVHALTMLTPDRTISKYPVKVLW